MIAQFVEPTRSFEWCECQPYWDINATCEKGHKGGRKTVKLVRNLILDRLEFQPRWHCDECGRSYEVTCHAVPVCVGRGNDDVGHKGGLCDATEGR